MSENEFPATAPLPLLQEVCRELGATYADKIGVNHGGIPRRHEVLELVDDLLEIILPGFGGKPRGHGEDVASGVEPLLEQVYLQICRLSCRIYHFFCCHGEVRPADCDAEAKSAAAAAALLRALPEIRESVKLDIAAAYGGDPAASSYEEIILAYPCIKTITIQRLAHVLYCQHTPLIPRLMTEHAHSLTGIDIHPGAKLGRGVFIDHGTGVVIGETAAIGDRVRIYQGVTLGALSFPKDACGMLIKGRKRHPTVEENVTIYAGATVLGDITIGHDSVIGGNVWLTESLPPHSKITVRVPEQRIRSGQATAPEN